MKYIAIFDLDDHNESLEGLSAIIKVPSVEDDGIECTIKPIISEMFIGKNGECPYITQGHIDAMVEYEQKAAVKELVERLNRLSEGVNWHDT